MQETTIRQFFKFSLALAFASVSLAIFHHIVPALGGLISASLIACYAWREENKRRKEIDADISRLDLRLRDALRVAQSTFGKLESETSVKEEVGALLVEAAGHLIDVPGVTRQTYYGGAALNWKRQGFQTVVTAQRFMAALGKKPTATPTATA